MNYRPEIDGLRALAVVPVILFHAGVTLFGGGFVGVDIFFVISGYLITTILLNDLYADRFSLITFYERRARRILPALFVVVFTCAIAAWFLLGPLDGAKFAKSILGVITFTSNIIFWLDEGYFESASELKPLLHTWSLAVEEQYYLFFPLLLMVAFRFARRHITLILCVIAVLSFALTQWVIVLNAERASIVSAGFFLLPTRAWELLIGSLVAVYLTRQSKVPGSLVVHQTLSFLGIVMILWAIFAFDEQTPFPSHYALLPTLGTALIILYAVQGTLAKALLSNRGSVGIGLASYSAYLWHQPVLAFYRYQQASTDITWPVLVGLMGIITVLAALTWKFVEQPFRDKTAFTQRVIFSYSALASGLALVVAAMFLIATSQFERHLAHALSQNEFVYFGNMDERFFVLNRLEYDNNDPSTLLIGSSRLMDVGSNIIGNDALNLSVSGASIEDMVALLTRGVERYEVKDIYIGADPWLFNEDAGQNRWRTISEQYDQALDVLDGKAEAEKVGTLSPTQTGSEMLDWISGFIQALYYASNLFDSAAPDGIPSNQSKKSIDGVHIYTVDYLSKSPEKIAAQFDALLDYSMSTYSFNSQREKLLEALVQSLQGYNVSLVLSPYHPNLYAKMVLEKPIFLEVEATFRAFTKKHNIALLGSYDPAISGCLAEDFHDGMHPNAVCMGKLFTAKPSALVRP